jgi:hypothetical protein
MRNSALGRASCQNDDADAWLFRKYVAAISVMWVGVGYLLIPRLWALLRWALRSTGITTTTSSEGGGGGEGGKKMFFVLILGFALGKWTGERAPHGD